MQGANASIINIKNCSVAGELDLKGMHCAAFRSNHLQAVGTHQIGPITVENDCSFNHATFGARVQLEVRAKSLNLSGAQFREGGYIKAEEARIYLSHVTTGRHLRIAGGMIKSEEPVIMSLQDADAGSMSFAHVDMSRCMFYGSHDLGEIVINASARFALTPPGHLKRRCIADEFAWRLHTKASKSTKWNLLGTEVVGDFQAQNEHEDIVSLPPLQASQVADVYRDLRRSFEGKGNGPGAADFYYGEMEMRRHDPERPLSERLILFFYWILSGYGLRASFAILWLIPLMIVGGILMSAFGFQNNCQPFVDGFVFTLRSIFPGLSHTTDLTLIGKVIEMGTKVLGTMLLALAVLAIRARVKR
ncbi:MAG: hypothetical protein NPIRA03_41460 [Nitrospirales bacterium]|nr:MAG: hypothetical protein NPIRA03_41460 [Nitrospirales bacterium]